LPLFINIILLAKCHYSSLGRGADAATSAEIQARPTALDKRKISHQGTKRR
jgi:hypothetical protein